MDSEDTRRKEKKRVDELIGVQGYHARELLKKESERLKKERKLRSRNFEVEKQKYYVEADDLPTKCRAGDSAKRDHRFEGSQKVECKDPMSVDIKDHTASCVSDATGKLPTSIPSASLISAALTGKRSLGTLLGDYYVLPVTCVTRADLEALILASGGGVLPSSDHHGKMVLDNKTTGEVCRINHLKHTVLMSEEDLLLLCYPFVSGTAIGPTIGRAIRARRYTA